VSFTEVVQRERVTQAERLLADRTLSLTEIALVTGFSDQAHFTGTFRRYLDVPPSALRSVVEPSRRGSDR
jgi:transcriptional regulator GlxA family with amidase domain